MLKINGNSIKLTRGDTAYLEITIYTPDGKVYELQKNDKLEFCVREFPKKQQNCPPLLDKVFEDRTIKINPNDTNFLKYGRYFWDVSLIFANGDINTVCSGDITFVYEYN